MNVKTASEKWNITEQRITALCRNGRIDGAKKENGCWSIPDDAERPDDGRFKNGKKELKTKPLLPLPIGVSSYRDAVSEYYYVDKTLLIRDFLDTIPKVSLFTRPRRFGKTLNMDMLRTFFEISGEDTSKYFKKKKIWECGEKYRSHQGKYPVVFLSFKDVKYDCWDKALRDIADSIAIEYARHSELSESDKCDRLEKDYYRKVVTKKADEVDLSRALSALSRMLYKHYGEAAVIIIDEYDTPIQQGYVNGYYSQVIGFIRNLFSGAFKDNEFLAYGFLTGILRVAKESIFSGLNNLKEHSILDERFSEYFGFTRDEVMQMLRYYKRADKADEICAWYDGYLFGKTEIFNPWSVISYIDNGCIPRAYWQSTGSNEIIGETVENASFEIQDNLQALLRGESISAYIDSSIIYPEIQTDPSSIYSFLLMTGYLKAADTEEWRGGSLFCDVKIPNKEILSVYGKEILSGTSDIFPQSTAIAVQQAVIKQDAEELKLQLEKLLKQTVSVFDTGHESFYHGWILGIYAIMNDSYRITSNRESGDGRYDIQLKPTNLSMPGILIEIKVLNDKTVADDMISEKLSQLAQTALGQINEKRYVTEMQSEGVRQIVKYGIAFYKKHVDIKSETESF